MYQPLNWATLHWVEQQRTVGNEEAASGSCCALPGSWMLGPGSWGAGCNSRAGRYCQGTTLLWCIYELALFAITMSPLHSSEAVNKRTKIPLPVKFPYGILYPVLCFYLYYIMCVCFIISLLWTFLNHYLLVIFLSTFQTEQHPCPPTPVGLTSAKQLIPLWLLSRVCTDVLANVLMPVGFNCHFDTA